MKNMAKEKIDLGQNFTWKNYKGVITDIYDWDYCGYDFEGLYDDNGEAKRGKFRISEVILKL